MTHSTVQQTTPVVESGPEQFANEPTPAQYTRQDPIGHGRIDVHNDAETGHDRRPPPPSHSEDLKQEVRPYFAGESEGLEFLFDVCCPDRTIRGLHYATPANTYRARRIHQKSANPSPLPAMPVQRELVRAFFLYLWPVLPVVDAKSFLSAFYAEDPALSPLLLWSIFYAAASVSCFCNLAILETDFFQFVDNNAIKTHRLGSRKQLKEFYYQNAKVILSFVIGMISVQLTSHRTSLTLKMKMIRRY